ncbi:MAG: isopeptide-forming domain-containing fimbrial protein, partial [Anaerolineae bacterium]|nr:isopeptide-forming domain-containing fimbrial protein [Anaerolineae bacterium]
MQRVLRWVLAFSLSHSIVTPSVAFAAPVPIVTIGGPSEGFIGTAQTFTLTFDNTGSIAPTIGYGPYIDLYLPYDSNGEAGEGLSFNAATYLGNSVSATPFTCTGANVVHPLTGLSVACPVGQQLVVLELPFGSFTPAQPAAEIEVSTNTSNLIDAGVVHTITARAGFQFGSDALDNKATDPVISSTLSSPFSYTPTVFRLTKTYIGPESETATGPNFPRQYRLDVDLAAGQTITNLLITDNLPSNVQFIGIDSMTPGCSATNTPSGIGGVLQITCAAVTGSASTADASVVFSFFVPRDDAASAPVLNANTGSPTTSVNDSLAGATWTPSDPDDPVANVSSNDANSDHTLTDRLIAIQKAARLITNTGATGYTPGDTVAYSLTFQVSDFFAFNNIVITDSLGDGLVFVPNSAQLQIDGNDYSLPLATMNAANVATTVNANGTSTLVFNVSNEQITRGQTGQLLGGCVDPVGSPTPDCASYNNGGTQGVVTFRATISNTFRNRTPSLVELGDTLTNTVTIRGAVLNTGTFAPTGSTASDTSSANITIVKPNLQKSVYAINGSTSLPSPLVMRPGDRVTYRITYQLPSTDFSNLILTDYLPLPAFNAS